MDTLITITQAALILGSTPSHVMQLCHTGQLPSGEVGGTVIIPTSAVEQLAKRSCSDTRRNGAGVHVDKESRHISDA